MYEDKAVRVNATDVSQKANLKHDNGSITNVMQAPQAHHDPTATATDSLSASVATEFKEAILYLHLFVLMASTSITLPCALRDLILATSSTPSY